MKHLLRSLICGTLFGLLAAGSARAQGKSAEPAKDTATQLTVNPQLARMGEKLFQSKLCSSCHSIGKGKVVGPDLKGVTNRRTVQWIKTMVTTPEIALERDSIAQRLRSEHGNISMPNLGIKEDEFEQLLHYLASHAK